MDQVEVVTWTPYTQKSTYYLRFLKQNKEYATNPEEQEQKEEKQIAIRKYQITILH